MFSWFWPNTSSMQYAVCTFKISLQLRAMQYQDKDINVKSIKLHISVSILHLNSKDGRYFSRHIAISSIINVASRLLYKTQQFFESSRKFENKSIMFPTLLHNINVCFSVSSVQRNQQTCLVNTNIHLSIWCKTILILNSITTDVKEIAGFGQLSTQRIDLVCGRKLRTLDYISRAPVEDFIQMCQDDNEKYTNPSKSLNKY